VHLDEEPGGEAGQHLAERPDVAEPPAAPGADAGLVPVGLEQEYLVGLDGDAPARLQVEQHTAWRPRGLGHGAIPARTVAWEG
jgi:hypothetical protein